MASPDRTTLQAVFILTSVMMLVLLLWLPGKFAHSNQMVTNDQLYDAIGGKAHTTMTEQKRRLGNILDGFLIGDWNRITRSLYRMARDIDKIADKYAPEPGTEDEFWQALGSIRQHITALEQAATQKNYEDSYRAFNNITFQCIRCHQVKRSWGTFYEEGASSAAGAPAIESFEEVLSADDGSAAYEEEVTEAPPAVQEEPAAEEPAAAAASASTKKAGRYTFKDGQVVTTY